MNKLRSLSLSLSLYQLTTYLSHVAKNIGIERKVNIRYVEMTLQRNIANQCARKVYKEWRKEGIKRELINETRILQ